MVTNRREPGDEPIVDIVTDPAGGALRDELQRVLGEFTTASATIRGLFYSAAVAEGATLTRLERLNGIRRQTISALIRRARRDL